MDESDIELTPYNETSQRENSKNLKTIVNIIGKGILVLVVSSMFLLVIYLVLVIKSESHIGNLKQEINSLKESCRL